ncbi:hypothetical protein NEOLEDRAFT_369216 [Neolentinus lepideus HHB14362 ss-1]|uniref:Uncharacterized protein n=1 Tax=Neolentinus lepideus HHB14362 ss-1 TaxID=1314782 RepID=A0A165SHA6_9AGAM|nr:hypothetical protein NEOLEDRAFT_369216 [Neolentinus lepideus HHB14362 ss-1]
MQGDFIAARGTYEESTCPTTSWFYTCPSALNSVITLNQLFSDNVAQFKPIVFALVMLGVPPATEGLLAVTSVLTHGSRTRNFIIQKKSIYLAYHVDMRFYPLGDDLIKARATRAGVETV